jgi:hypothetical protein
MVGIPSKITCLRHPSYAQSSLDWSRWRLSFEAGVAFRDRYLEMFSNRETVKDFNRRKNMTPIPAFAQAAVLSIRNAIFQRLTDVARHGGSESYRNAIAGMNGGVNRSGATMNYFIGDKVLTELLVMKQCGVYVDMPVIGENPTLYESKGKRPYVYSYPVESIVNWAKENPDAPDDFTALLLQDDVQEYEHGLPTCKVQRFRHVWIDPSDGYVRVQFYNPDSEPISDVRRLGLRQIPFHLADIGLSLIDNASTYQIALLNLASSDVAYAQLSNFPFYVEQGDNREAGAHLKETDTDGTATVGGQGSEDRSISAGPTQGRRYPMGADAPQFIAPPSDTLKISMELQEKYDRDIRKLVNLAVSSLSTRASAESKEMDNDGLNAGLSFIGFQLEATERKIAQFWAAYEETNETRRNFAVVKYPERYSLKSDKERLEEAGKLTEVMYSVPSLTAKKELSKMMATTLLSGRVRVDVLEKIHKEVDAAKYTTSDPDIVEMAKDKGLAGGQVLSESLGYAPDQWPLAQKEHIDRLIEIAKAQSEFANQPTDMGARGVNDLSADANAGKDEKAASRNTDTKPTTEEPVRGEGK